MKLPGMQYQDKSWRTVKTRLGEASLKAFQADGVENLNDFVHEMRVYLYSVGSGSHMENETNWLGNDVLTLASELVEALPAVPRLASRIEKLLGDEKLPTESHLRQNANNVFSELRDYLDADSFKAWTGEPMSANMIGCLRTTDQAERATRDCLNGWRGNLTYASQILDREISPGLELFEISYLERNPCKPNWVLRWSQFHEQHYQVVGPLHTKSKQCTFSEANVARWLDMIRGKYSSLVTVDVPNILDILRNMADRDEEEAGNPLGSLNADLHAPGIDSTKVMHEEDGALDKSFSACIPENLELPVKVGVFLERTACYRDLLLETLESWGVFELWGLPVSLEKLTNAELARRLSDLRKQKVSPYLFQKEVGAASEALEVRIKQLLISNARHEGEE